LAPVSAIAFLARCRANKLRFTCNMRAMWYVVSSCNEQVARSSEEGGLNAIPTPVQISHGRYCDALQTWCYGSRWVRGGCTGAGWGRSGADTPYHLGEGAGVVQS
jgi:hypothetical protein